MADLAYDAVIVGGGNKAVLLAMYLQKYGGMSVGVFERRHEIGGCLATEESAAPGFRGNTHATVILPWYYLPVWRDFPEFWEYGAQWEQYLSSDGYVFRNNETCLGIYSVKHDPTQERTAEQLARFSQRDAENWLKLWQVWQSDEYQRVQIDNMFLPAEAKADPAIMERQMAVYGKVLEAGFVMDSVFLAASPLRMVREWFDSAELQCCILRFVIGAITDVNESGQGPLAMGIALTLPTIGFNRGGTHMIAHSAHQICTQLGVEWHTNTEVEKVLIENGAATGIRLMDGSEVRAKKIVVSAGLHPRQLCFDLIGREHLDGLLARRVELIEDSFGGLMWYTYAIHEAPRYKAAAFNPDINECMWLGLMPDPDPVHLANECKYTQLQKWPPIQDYCPAVWCHSLVDPSYAPPGKHVANTEQLVPGATAHSEKEWLEIKKRYADDLLTLWQDYAPNMTWDNVIGVDTNSPYDCLRMSNLSPNGQMGGIDRTLYQTNQNRPTPELANHRTPIENLYATGTFWHTGSSASASESYNCYRIIANDLELGKPWEEQGKEEPDSLVEEQRAMIKRLQGQCMPEVHENK